WAGAPRVKAVVCPFLQPTAAGTAPAAPWTPVGADSISARTAAAKGSPGGINPAPTNKFYALDQPEWPRPHRQPQGGMLSSRRTCGGANAPVLKSPRCGGRRAVSQAV